MPVRNRFPRSLSLKNQADIDRLIKSGAKIPGDSFLLFWENADSFHWAVLIARRTGNAPLRNRLKRRFKEAIRLNRSILTQPVSVAVIPSYKASQLPFARIHAEISRLFDRINNSGK